MDKNFKLTMQIEIEIKNKKRIFRMQDEMMKYELRFSEKIEQCFSFGVVFWLFIGSQWLWSFGSSASPLPTPLGPPNVNFDLKFVLDERLDGISKLFYMKEDVIPSMFFSDGFFLAVSETLHFVFPKSCGENENCLRFVKNTSFLKHTPKH